MTFVRRELVFFAPSSRARRSVGAMYIVILAVFMAG